MVYQKARLKCTFEVLVHFGKSPYALDFKQGFDKKTTSDNCLCQCLIYFSLERIPVTTSHGLESIKEWVDAGNCDHIQQESERRNRQVSQKTEQMLILWCICGMMACSFRRICGVTGMHGNVKPIWSFNCCKKFKVSIFGFTALLSHAKACKSLLAESQSGSVVVVRIFILLSSL